MNTYIKGTAAYEGSHICYCCGAEVICDKPGPAPTIITTTAGLRWVIPEQAESD